MKIREPRQRYTDEQIARAHRSDTIFLRWYVGTTVAFYAALIAVLAWKVFSKS